VGSRSSPWGGAPFSTSQILSQPGPTAARPDRNRAVLRNDRRRKCK